MPTTIAETEAVRGSDLDSCREELKVGSRSFHAAAMLLPRSFCEPASALYAFCRLADDAVDDNPDPAAGLRELRRRLDGIYTEVPYPIAADRALARVIRKYGIPKAVFEAMFEGFAWDAEHRRYETLGDLLDYAARVAGTVGVMMALLMGVRDRDRLARAADLGAAMQLSNIARDCGEDARLGRVYLPLAWLREADIDADAWLADPRYSEDLAKVVRRLLFEAERLYRRADSGIAHLPRNCRPAIHAARVLYAEIGHEVGRRGCDSVSRRAVVSPLRKLVALARLIRPGALASDQLREPALASTAFLVEAVARSEPAVKPVRAAEESRVSWMLGLFEEMDRRDRAATATSKPLTQDAGP